MTTKKGPELLNVSTPAARPTLDMALAEVHTALTMRNKAKQALDDLIAGSNPANDRGAKYHLNDTDTQLKNAYAMSQFVLHISEEQEKILNDTD